MKGREIKRVSAFYSNNLEVTLPVNIDVNEFPPLKADSTQSSSSLVSRGNLGAVRGLGHKK